MPIPKPLSKSASKGKKQKRMASVMHDLKHGPHHAERTRAQEIAIAMKSSGESNKKAAPKKKKATAYVAERKSGRRPRNIGRS